MTPEVYIVIAYLVIGAAIGWVLAVLDGENADREMYLFLGALLFWPLLLLAVLVYVIVKAASVAWEALSDRLPR